MRILVTGGAGFIGARLVHRLVDDDYVVSVLDDLSSGSPGAVSTRADLIPHDIVAKSTADTIHRINPDAIVHAAAQVSVPASMSDPARDLEVNVRGTLNVLEGARRANTKRFVFLSSGGAVYGDVPNPAGASERRPPRPISPYGIHKLAAERHVAISGLPYAVARLANVYGPGQRVGLEGGVVATFIDRARRGMNLELHGDGSQTRDFVHVDDVVDAVRLMSQRPENGVWNVGTGTAISVSDLAAWVTKLADPGIELVHGPMRPGDVRSSVLDVKRIHLELGWAPQRQLSAQIRTLLATHD